MTSACHLLFFLIGECTPPGPHAYRLTRCHVCVLGCVMSGGVWGSTNPRDHGNMSETYFGATVSNLPPGRLGGCRHVQSFQDQPPQVLLPHWEAPPGPVPTPPIPPPAPTPLPTPPGNVFFVICFLQCLYLKECDWPWIISVYQPTQWTVPTGRLIYPSYIWVDTPL